jgi:hypothetical protein
MGGGRYAWAGGVAKTRVAELSDEIPTFCGELPIMGGKDCIRLGLPYRMGHGRDMHCAVERRGLQPWMAGVIVSATR